MKNSLPKNLQPVLWSARIKNLDLEKDKIYIIHQILAFGNLKQLKWLLSNYSLNEIKKVFLQNPQPIYTPQIFKFIKSMVLDSEKIKLKKENYVKSFLASSIRGAKARV